MHGYFSTSLPNVVSWDASTSWVAKRLYETIDYRKHNARFQQKQMLEKEEKLLKLYESQQQRAFERVGRGSAGSNTSNASIGSNGGGKVRQMFDERRQKAGIDKSYPLEPLKSKNAGRGPNTDRQTKGAGTKTVVKTVKAVGMNQNGKTVVNKRETVQNNNYRNSASEESDRVDNNSRHILDLMNNHNLKDSLENEVMSQPDVEEKAHGAPLYMTGKLANVGGKLPSQMQEASIEQNGAVQKSTSSMEPRIASKYSPKSSTVPRAHSSASSSSTTSPSPRPESMQSSKSKQGASPGSRASPNVKPSARQIAKSPVVRDDLSECRYCGRRFATDRLDVHEDICGKSGKKKRKAYDATKHRVQGTELETYVLRGPKKGTNSKAIAAKSAGSKKDWRKTHEEFIAAIRAAKQAQAHIAAGGKLADLPPPPPSTNPDYVQCPSCGRRFNEAAAERHIPKCATFQFNKPKAGASQNKGRPGKR
ncbi:zinc finger C2HC domain-containing protein 1C isoform X2 [Cylas formicarius]|uniref:zinc finger C2HC domain-containing protein 1C isoform X2 n=1 Tax=Cylas formicarius TaxID=197179 RepID=UPI0029585AE3|nr:zinc finger C2HC domain-containing protein 1C isoform X2 [Cylas formicarius]